MLNIELRTVFQSSILLSELHFLKPFFFFLALDVFPILVHLLTIIHYCSFIFIRVEGKLSAHTPNYAVPLPAFGGITGSAHPLWPW